MVVKCRSKIEKTYERILKYDGLFGYDLHFLPRVVRGDGDCGWGLLREAKLQGGAG